MKKGFFSKLLVIGGILIAGVGFLAWHHTSHAADYYDITLSFNANGGSNAPSSVSCKTSANKDQCSVTIPSQTPTRSGYTFRGWITKTSFNLGMTIYQPGVSYTLTSDDTLYALWETGSTSTTSYTYTVYYNANGGSGAPATQTATSTSTTYSMELNYSGPTRSGYKFLGWSRVADGSAGYQSSGSITLTSANPTATMYAIWTEDAPTSYTYTLYYDANGGSGAPATQTATSTSTTYDMTVSNTTPTRSGYTFLGWSTSSSDTSGSIEPGSIYRMYSSYLSSATLYAIWQSNSTSTDTGNTDSGNTGNTDTSTNTNNTGSTTTTSYAINANLANINTTGGIAIRGTGDLAKFVSLKINGSVVDSSHYALSSGSTVVTLNSDYLNSLGDGTYDVTMTWTDGEANTKLIIFSDSDGNTIAVINDDTSQYATTSDSAASNESASSEASTETDTTATSGTAAPKTGAMAEEDNSASTASIVKFIAIAAVGFFAAVYVYNRFVKHRSAKFFSSHSDWE